MKELIGLIRLGALTAFSVALYSGHRQTQATHTTQTSDNHHSKKSDRQAGPEGELVLLDIDGTVIAREISLAQPWLTSQKGQIMKQLGQDKSAELLQRPLDEECETNELVNKMTEDVVNSDPLMELQFASISLDPRGNIIIWNTNSLCPGNVRTAESFKLPRRKVADHREYFSVEGQQDAANALAELDPQFGYSF